MGWGVLESSRTQFPLGTTQVGIKDTSPNDDAATLETAKRAGTTVLAPQPSDDPNDPLNWTTTWKWTHLLLLAFGSALANAATTMLTPGLEPLTEELQSNPGDVGTWIVTAPTFFTSAAAFFVAAGGDVWGRRPFYVYSVALMAIVSFGSFFFSKSFPLMTLARTLAGLFAAPLFTLLTATISDIFFVHQRGKSIAMWNLMLNAGAQIGQVLAGVVTDKFGVAANFITSGILWTALIPLFYFVIFESAYFGRKTEDVTSIEVTPNKLTSEWDTEDFRKANLPAKKTYSELLRLSNGRVSDKPFWMGVIKPLGLISSPIIFYSCFLNTMMFILLAGMSTIVSILLSAPPYDMSPAQIGLTNLPLFVGGLIFSPLFGWMSDASVGWMAAHNGTKKGVAEPEFRMALLTLTTPITIIGLIGLGTAFHNSLPLFWIIVWMTLVNIGSLGGVQVAIGYVIDCFPEHSAQAFSTVNMTGALALTVALGPLIGLLEMEGPLFIFGILASGSAIVVAMALPLWVFGKKMRAWYAESAVGRMLLT